MESFPSTTKTLWAGNKKDTIKVEIGCRARLCPAQAGRAASIFFNQRRHVSLFKRNRAALYNQKDISPKMSARSGRLLRAVPTIKIEPLPVNQ